MVSVFKHIQIGLNRLSQAQLHVRMRLAASTAQETLTWCAADRSLAGLVVAHP
jgi:hypothetical protein